MRPRRARAVLIGLGRTLRAAWWMLGLTLLLLLLVEATLRGVLAVKDRLRPLPIVDPRVVSQGYGGAAWVDDLYREQAEVTTGRRPYVVFRTLPFEGRYISIDEQGFRRTPRPEPAAAIASTSPLRIELAGGSVAWGMGARDEATLAARMVVGLNQKGTRVQIINRAQIGYVSTQEVVDLMLDLRDRPRAERPELIVFVDGVNDVLSAYQNGRAGWPQNEANRVAEFNIRESGPRLLGGLLRRLVADSALGRVTGSIALRARASSGGERPAGLNWSEELADEVVENYRANVEQVDRLAHQYGFRALFVWQPVLFTKREKTEYEAEKAREYAWLARPLADVAGRLGRLRPPSERVRVVDLSALLDQEPGLMYVDFCHLTEDGQARLGAAIAEELTRWTVEGRQSTLKATGESTQERPAAGERPEVVPCLSP